MANDIYYKFVCSDGSFITEDNLQYMVKGGGSLLTITLYKNTSERNRVDKTDYLKNYGTIKGTFRDSCDIINPEIVLQLTSYPKFNYCYIDKLNRYYYVESVVILTTNTYLVNLSCDVLMSYKDGIKGLVGFIDRNEHTFNENIIDKYRVIEQGYDIEVYDVENKVFTGDVNLILSGLNLEVYGI